MSRTVSSAGFTGRTRYPLLARYLKLAEVHGAFARSSETVTTPRLVVSVMVSVPEVGFPLAGGVPVSLRFLLPARSAFFQSHWLAVVLAAQTTRAADPDKLLPADAEFVLSVNVKQIVESDIIKKYALAQMKQALQGNDAQKMLKELGLDPLKDIDRVVLGGSGKWFHAASLPGVFVAKGKLHSKSSMT